MIGQYGDFGKTVYESYTVKAGDSLSKISQDFFGDFSQVQVIADANGISNLNAIKEGDILQIPMDDGQPDNTSTTVVSESPVVTGGTYSPPATTQPTQTASMPSIWSIFTTPPIVPSTTIQTSPVPTPISVPSLPTPRPLTAIPTGSIFDFLKPTPGTRRNEMSPTTKVALSMIGVAAVLGGVAYLANKKK